MVGKTNASGSIGLPADIGGLCIQSFPCQNLVACKS